LTARNSGKRSSRASRPAYVDRTVNARCAALETKIALLGGTDGFFITRREQIAALAARYAVPANVCF
jgi:hypothetical protein